MSTSIDQAFVRQYEREVHHEFQRRGSRILNVVRHKSGVVGTSTTFQKVGKGEATTKARHGVITPMNADHTAITCTIADYYAGDWVDKLDEAKVNIDERQVIARTGAKAIGRKIDSLLFTAMDGTTNTLSSGIVGTSAAQVRSDLIEFVEAIIANDVDPADGMVYACITPRVWAWAMTVEEFASSDYVAMPGFVEGAPVSRWKRWMDVNWCTHTGLPGQGTASAKNFIFHHDAVGFASQNLSGNMENPEMMKADITWHGDRAAHFVNNMFGGGACLIDDAGVIEAASDDTTAVPTS